MFNEEAIREYIETQHKIQTEIEKLQDELAEHNEVSRITWGHVGDMKNILNQLKQINGEE
jgi:hypothetical protein